MKNAVNMSHKYIFASTLRYRPNGDFSIGTFSYSTNHGPLRHSVQKKKKAMVSIFSCLSENMSQNQTVHNLGLYSPTILKNILRLSIQDLVNSKVTHLLIG